MGRGTTARRGRAPGEFGRRGIFLSHASLSSSTPPNGENSLSSSSDTGSPPSLVDVRELPSRLIQFVSGNGALPEPPRKRRKLAENSSTEGEPELEHIVVKQSVWDIKCAGSQLYQLETPIERKDIRLYVHWNSHLAPEDIQIMDDTKSSVFHARLPPLDQHFEDIYLALLVDQESTKRAKSNGKLWTEFGISLLRKDGFDFIRIMFTVKWNTTISPYHVPQASSKSQALSKVLNKYFPDGKSVTTQDNKWSPQDFYQAVHTPDKNDEVSASMMVEELESDLYPFQKRAVQWLLRKEGVQWSTEGRVKSLSDDSILPLSFVQARDAQGRQCYVSHLFGIVALDIKPFTASERQLKGGVLAEEMGLGKTVEMISLITLHKRPKEPAAQIFDLFTGENVRPTAATLIIAPPSILPQWISEVNKHAPHLKVMHYEGIKAHSKKKGSQLVDDLADSDIVISTYSVLAAEIHFTQLNPERTLRRESKYPRPKSPLMQLSWWRVLMDEAQMIESGVGNAAVVARMIPRINAWCVTGTPVRKDVNDLLGLLIFLRYEPYASIKHVWLSLISSHKQEFRKLFGILALRHSKKGVRDELKLPAQRRYVITMPFTPIEEQHYQELFNRMCDECGLDSQGAPLVDAWDPDTVSDTMRRWLVRLRQTALHPEIGGRNRRALGTKDGPLRTVDQVLAVMMDQTDVLIRTDQRALLISKLKRGQLFENSPRVKEALDIWIGAVNEASEVVEECREQLRQEVAGAQAEGKSGKSSAHASGFDSDSADEQEE